MEMSSSSLVTKKLQNKTIMRCHYTPIRMAKIHNKIDNTKYSWGCWATGTLSLLVRIQNGTSLEDSLTVCYKAKCCFTIQSSNWTHYYLPNWFDNLYSYGNQHVNVNNSFIHNCQKLEAFKVSFNRWADTFTCATSI